MGPFFVALMILTGWTSLAVQAEDAAEYEICVLTCDRKNVEFSTGMAGPGADQEGMVKEARQRYALCLYHCDPALERRPTLLRLFPPLGRLAESKRRAMSTADQHTLCIQDCDTAASACAESNFGNTQVCTRGAEACYARCDNGYLLVPQQPAAETDSGEAGVAPAQQIPENIGLPAELFSDPDE